VTARQVLCATLAVATSVMLGGGCTANSPPAASALQRAIDGPLIAGWNLTTPELVRAAASRGVTVALLYGRAPTPDSPLGTALTSAHIRVITAEVADRVSSYECTRTHTITPPPTNADDYCTTSTGYTADQLLADTTTIAQRDAVNPLIVGHWILDDVAGWDTAGLKNVLQQIRDLLPPTQATVCGFSASLGGETPPQWDPRRAANFSPHGCDAVAPYIYSTPVPPNQTPTTIDWTMATVLPKVKKTLHANHWDQNQTPMIGIGQAWAGRHEPDDAIEQLPTTDNMLTQARAFINAGAIGVGWYAWKLSNYSQARTPANDPQLARGVEQSAQLIQSHSPQAPQNSSTPR
jgi:hypothetical protein